MNKKDFNNQLDWIMTHLKKKSKTFDTDEDIKNYRSLFNYAIGMFGTLRIEEKNHENK